MSNNVSQLKWRGGESVFFPFFFVAVRLNDAVILCSTKLRDMPFSQILASTP